VIENQATSLCTDFSIILPQVFVCINMLVSGVYTRVCACVCACMHMHDEQKFKMHKMVITHVTTSHK